MESLLVGAGGCQGSQGTRKGELRSWQSCVEVPELSPWGLLPWHSSQAELPRAGLGLQGSCGQQGKKPCAHGTSAGRV